MNMLEVWELDIVTYLMLKRDAVIYNHSKTEEGREYLYNCWRMEQTKPDRELLRKKFKKDGDKDGE